MPSDGVNLKRTVGNYFLNEDDEFKLGEGAFGKVYRAEHIQSGIPVAVKKVAKEKAKYDELAAVIKLNNDNVIGVIDLVHRSDDQEADGGDCVFVILELCDADLRVHLKNQEDGRLNSWDFDLVTESLARGYIALYEKSIIHRDIKPENILLKYASNGEIRGAKIGDFGASRLIGPECGDKALTSLAGTPLYMAPEIGANIVADREYGHDVDMWSVGVLLYECFHGQLPFDERALCRLFLFAANGNYEGYGGPPWPVQCGSKLSYDGLIHRLLELNVDERLSPLEFHCWVVHQKVLVDEMAVKELDVHSNDSTSCRRRQFRLRGGDGCCKENRAKCEENSNKIKFIENNNNYKVENKNGHYNMNGSDCKNGKNTSDRELEKTTDKKATASVCTLTYALERFIWFYGVLLGFSFSCYGTRHYGYDR